MTIFLQLFGCKKLGEWKRNTWRLLETVDDSKNRWCYAIFCKYSIIIFCKILFLHGAINDEEWKIM